MKNPFKAYQDYVSKTPRNSFDMSHRNNLSLPVGLLVPDLVQDVTAGDSLELDAAFAFNFLPMIYPVQTPIRINQYFFYVRYRNTWDNFKDFRYGNKECVHPYLDRPASFFKTGGLADYMGIPTTISVGDTGYVSVIFDHDPSSDLRTGHSNAPLHIHSGSGSGSLGLDPLVMSSADLVSALPWFALESLVSSAAQGNASIVDIPYSSLFNPVFSLGYWNTFSLRINNISHNFAATNVHDPLLVFNCAQSLVEELSLADPVYLIASSDDGTDSKILTQPLVVELDALDATTLSINNNSSPSVADTLNALLESYGHYNLSIVFYGVNKLDGTLQYCRTSPRAAQYIQAVEPMDIGDHPELNPFIKHDGEDSPTLKINALPFRAYEQIYNSYFRNERVEPFMKSGEVEYNDFGTTYEDGADTTPYHMFNRNWELDVLTSCLPSPQQGTAPIVGVDSRHITFSDGERQYHFAYQTGDNGELVADGAHFDETNVPGQVRNAAVDLIANGFTIESLREANAMQLWLEKNYRRGLRYRDQLKSHTGIDLDWDELELPEFLGGFSHYVDVSSVTASASTEEAVLGDIAGQAAAFKKANHRISHFFREDGVVIGLICITPQPVYSQILPKFYLRTSALDYQNSEFSHLGMQGVPYKEVAPLQMYQEMLNGGSRTMESVFGYNRPNYDMVSRYDEVHGLLRTTDRDFVMMRIFDGVPELGASFIHCQGQHLNDVFTVTDPHGHIARGQVAFKMYMKRPIPAVGEPRLES